MRSRGAGGAVWSGDKWGWWHCCLRQSQRTTKAHDLLVRLDVFSFFLSLLLPLSYCWDQTTVTLFWPRSKDGVAAKTAGRFTLRETHDGAEELRISPGQTSDSGLYMCKIINEYGSRQAEFRVEVTGALWRISTLHVIQVILKWCVTVFVLTKLQPRHHWKSPERSTTCQQGLESRPCLSVTSSDLQMWTWTGSLMESWSSQRSSTVRCTLMGKGKSAVLCDQFTSTTSAGGKDLNKYHIHFNINSSTLAIKKYNN